MALDFTISGPSGGISMPQNVSLAGGEEMGVFDTVWRVECFVDGDSTGYSPTSWSSADWPKISVLSASAGDENGRVINYTYGGTWGYHTYGVSMAFYLKIYTLEWNGSGYDSNEYNTNTLNFYINLPAPTKADTPIPTHTATEVDWSARGLSWDDGGGADTYDIYFGLTGALSLISSAQAGTSITVDVGNVPYPETGEAGAAFYWRVDATNAAGTTTGDVWYFDARPAKASVPSPANTATGVVLGLTSTWTASAIAGTFDTYADVGAGLVLQSAGLESATWTPSPTIFDYITEYTWRVDSLNIYGITEGDEWTFTTLRFSAPTVTYFYPTTGQYYQLLIQSDGSYGDVPGVGVEDTDYVFLAAGYEPNFIKTTRKLVGIANSKVWYEDI